jgi:hypothetical protein
VRIASRTTHGGIGEEDWSAIGGGESGYFALDRKNPRLIYGSAGLGAMTEYDAETNVTRHIDPYPMFAGFRPARELRYRPNWNAPIRISQQHPDAIYWGSQKLLKSTDRGVTWTEISPDLTRARPATMGTTGFPIQIEGAGGEHYATLSDFVISPLDDRVIYTGSDDGLVHLTRDGGKTWTDITPKGLPEGLVNSIEVSPTTPGADYIAFTRYKLDDDTPYAFKTIDYGASWTNIAAGLPADHFVQVVREDPKRSEILYLGTNDSVHVSFDSGRNWQTLALNLPIVPVNDLQVHDDELVATTQGRGIWILGGLGPLRELDAGAASEAVHFFAPEPAPRLEGGRDGHDSAQGINPPNGAVFYYSLARPAKVATLTIVDANGHVVKRFTSAPGTAATGSENVKGAETQPPSPPLSLKKGMNRYFWDLRRDAFVPIADTIRFVSFRPPRIGAGSYEARLSIDGKVVERELHVLPHPGAMLGTAAQWAEEQTLSETLYEMVNQDHTLTNAIRATEAKLTTAKKLPALVAKMEAWQKQVPQSPLPNGTVDKISFPSSLLTTQILHTLSIADGPPPVSTGVKLRTTELAAMWAKMRADGERLLTEAGPYAVRNSPPLGRGLSKKSTSDEDDDDEH